MQREAQERRRGEGAGFRIFYIPISLVAFPEIFHDRKRSEAKSACSAAAVFIYPLSVRLFALKKFLCYNVNREIVN